MAKPSVKTPSDIKGKLVSVGGAKDITRIYVERMLGAGGVKPGEFDMTYAVASYLSPPCNREQWMQPS